MPGTPVKLVWSREEDLTHSHYRPLGMARMRAALSADGRLTAWLLVQAALGNAIFAATGRRVRRLPLLSGGSLRRE